MSENPHLLEPALGRPAPVSVVDDGDTVLIYSSGGSFRTDHAEGRKLYEALKKVYNDPWK